MDVSSECEALRQGAFRRLGCVRSLRVGASNVRGSGTPGTRLRWLVSAFCCASVLAAPASPGVAEESPLLALQGMTFVASRGDANELVLRAARARFQAGDQRVYLEEVHAAVEPGNEAGSFEIDCDRGSLDMESNDFEAIGNVRGHTESGRVFSAPWVRYDHDAGLLFTNAPVLISEDAITYRGGGFRYYVRERRFRLLGGASVVQER